MIRTRAVAAVMVALLLPGCVASTQNRYNYRDVGQATVVEFGTIVAARQVDITGPNTGTGALLGAGAGGALGSQVGSGGGNIAAIVGGLAVGAIAGAVAEQALQDSVGMEYVVTLQNGKTITIVQNQGKDDVVFAPGSRVMVQVSGSYQRVLPAAHLPEQIKRPKGINVVD